MNKSNWPLPLYHLSGAEFPERSYHCHISMLPGMEDRGGNMSSLASIVLVRALPKTNLAIAVQ